MTDSAVPLKYAPLVTFLTARPWDTVTVTLSLPEIEQVIGLPLPAGAFARVWWTARRDRDRQLRPWVRAGWRVATTAMRTVPPTVTFARIA
jgi:hypothetical protein